MERKRFSLKIKSVDDTGKFTGLTASYNTVDLGGDKILPGAFTRTLAAGSVSDAGYLPPCSSVSCNRVRQLRPYLCATWRELSTAFSRCVRKKAACSRWVTSSRSSAVIGSRYTGDCHMPGHCPVVRRKSTTTERQPAL
jgi:hypothetical protein